MSKKKSKSSFVNLILANEWVGTGKCYQFGQKKITVFRREAWFYAFAVSKKVFVCKGKWFCHVIELALGFVSVSGVVVRFLWYVSHIVFKCTWRSLRLSVSQKPFLFCNALILNCVTKGCNWILNHSLFAWDFW